MPASTVSLRREKPDAFLVLQDQGMPLIRLVDWAGDEQEIMSLIDSVVAQNGRVAISTWINSTSEAMKQHLDFVGFCRDPSEGRRGLLIKSLTPETENWRFGRCQILDKENWELRMIFSDRY